MKVDLRDTRLCTASSLRRRSSGTLAQPDAHSRHVESQVGGADRTGRVERRSHYEVVAQRGGLVDRLLDILNHGRHALPALQECCKSQRLESLEGIVVGAGDLEVEGGKTKIVQSHKSVDRRKRRRALADGTCESPWMRTPSAGGAGQE